MTRLLIVVAVVLLCATACVPPEPPVPADPVRFAEPTTTAVTGPLSADSTGLVAPVAGGELRIDPGTLAVTAVVGDPTVLADPVADLGDPTPPTVQDGTAQWRLPAVGLTASARTADGRLEVTVDADRDTELRWPVTGTDPA